MLFFFQRQGNKPFSVLSYENEKEHHSTEYIVSLVCFCRVFKTVEFISICLSTVPCNLNFINIQCNQSLYFRCIVINFVFQFSFYFDSL